MDAKNMLEGFLNELEFVHENFSKTKVFTSFIKVKKYKNRYTFKMCLKSFPNAFSGP